MFGSGLLRMQKLVSQESPAATLSISSEPVWEILVHQFCLEVAYASRVRYNLIVFFISALYWSCMWKTLAQNNISLPKLSGIYTEVFCPWAVKFFRSAQLHTQCASPGLLLRSKSSATPIELNLWFLPIQLPRRRISSPLMRLDCLCLRRCGVSWISYIRSVPQPKSPWNYL